MAEQETAADPILAPSSSPSALSVRTTKPGTKRLLVTLSILLSGLVFLPIFYKSTEIYRSPLPFSSISFLSSHLHSLRPPIPTLLHVLFLRSHPIDSTDSHRISDLITLDLQSRTKSQVSVSISAHSGEGLESLDLSDDEAMDAFLLGMVDASVYTVVVVERAVKGNAKVVVGKHRHAWVVGLVEDSEVARVIAGVFWKYFVNGGREDGEMVGGEEGDALPVGSDGSLVLSFSLLNADPSDGVYDWNIQKADRVLAPILESLAPIANITVESQVLYHAPKSSISNWDDSLRGYALSTSALPFFVNSNEWHLDTSIAAPGRSKVLQFVVYVPSATEWPLVLQFPNGETSQTNSFVSPMWGGVVVWNPPESSRNVQKPHFGKHIISTEDLQKIFQVFVGQLRVLFGLRSNNLDDAEIGVTKFLATPKGFTAWELDVLHRRHTYLNLLSCASTLDSLSKLVKSLPRMIIMDEIGKQVKLSVEVASLAQNYVSHKIYNASAVSSRNARALAEDAFYHPSIMSISYSSFEHTIAIYMPFFVPVSLQVLIAAKKELTRYKRERAKYLASIA
ncbi:GPI transamidase component PIG-S [Dioscorea cayenensis subsp. rotundata]|uniref:GPI transamidase component PIG-S n=1 Tax=Dioscorea cayennensis subsp. rotundata TaxID=55577 RepID=A0AB40B4S9_DIOCR|nr:GPI transamidase component PIG-S [Dioscorea cayenensis subsp. rotundata]